MSTMKILAFLLWIIYFTGMIVIQLFQDFSIIKLMVSTIVLMVGIGIPAAIIGASE